jgi:hypothetical protein
LVSDGTWAYSYDIENRLASMTAKAQGGVNNVRKLEFRYDYLGRRFSKTALLSYYDSLIANNI